MTYRAWNTKTVDRAALKELTAAIAQQNTEELEYQNMDEEWSEEKVPLCPRGPAERSRSAGRHPRCPGHHRPAEALTLLAGRRRAERPHAPDRHGQSL